MQSATVPPGRVTRAISRMPWSGSLMNAITSWASAASNAPSSHGSASAPPTRTSAPGWRSRQASANCAAGSIAATRSAPVRATSSCASPPGPQPTSRTRMPDRHAGRIGERHGERRRVAPHEAVVVLGRGDELHRPTQPPLGPSTVNAAARGLEEHVVGRVRDLGARAVGARAGRGAAARGVDPLDVARVGEPVAVVARGRGRRRPAAASRSWPQSAAADAGVAAPDDGRPVARGPVRARRRGSRSPCRCRRSASRAARRAARRRRRRRRSARRWRGRRGTACGPRARRSRPGQDGAAGPARAAGAMANETARAASSARCIGGVLWSEGAGGVRRARR